MAVDIGHNKGHPLTADVEAWKNFRDTFDEDIQTLGLRFEQADDWAKSMAGGNPTQADKDVEAARARICKNFLRPLGDMLNNEGTGDEFVANSNPHRIRYPLTLALQFEKANAIHKMKFNLSENKVGIFWITKQDLGRLSSESESWSNDAATFLRNPVVSSTINKRYLYIINAFGFEDIEELRLMLLPEVPPWLRKEYPEISKAIDKIRNPDGDTP